MTTTADGQFRTARTMHRILLGAAFAYVFVAERTVKSPRPVPMAFSLSFFVMAGFVVIIAYSFRARVLEAATESLKQNPQDTQDLLRWRQANITVMVLLLSITPLGFALRFVGGRLLTVIPFYLASILLLFVWRPQELPRSKLADSNSAEIRPE